jgi:hypothetical protein
LKKKGLLFLFLCICLSICWSSEIKVSVLETPSIT